MQDHESIARFYDLSLDDIPLVKLVRHCEEPDDATIDLAATVAVLRAKGLNDVDVRVASRSLFRDELRRRPDLDHATLETMSTRFDSSLSHVLNHHQGNCLEIPHVR